MAFDAAASSYDPHFSTSRLGRWLRQAVWQTLARTFEPGQRVLELGCGTGEDAVWLAQRGVSVVATDASAGMLAVASAKARAAGVGGRVHLAQVDAGRLGAIGGVYDGALADFGVVNCVEDRPGLAEALAERLRPGGALVAVVMGPLCVWEMGWYLLHGDAGRALRRWRSGGLAHVASHGGAPAAAPAADVKGVGVRVWYPTPRRLRADLGPRFDLQRLIGLGTLLPPSYLSHLVERWPNVFGVAARLDQRVPFGPWLADHYVAVFERR